MSEIEDATFVEPSGGARGLTDVYSKIMTDKSPKSERRLQT
jgi:hypothetical protein